MKLKNISLLLFTFISISVFSADIKLNDGENYFRVTSKSVSDFTFINSISEMQTIVVKTEEGDFIKLVIPSYSSDSKDGDAELPIMKQLIRVPFGSEMKIIILNKEETIINILNNLINISKIVFIKDHFQQGAVSNTIIRIMDFLGNYFNDVKTPKNYYSIKTFEKFIKKTNSKIIERVTKSLKVNKTLTTLREGVKMNGVKLRLAYFKPSHNKTPEHEIGYKQNRLSIIRQLAYSTKNKNEIDLGFFINGVPVATAELKNALTSQNHHNAIKQYMQDRDPKGEPLLEFQRCLVHFAAGTEKVFMTTKSKIEIEEDSSMSIQDTLSYQLIY